MPLRNKDAMRRQARIEPVHNALSWRILERLTQASNRFPSALIICGFALTFLCAGYALARQGSQPARPPLPRTTVQTGSADVDDVQVWPVQGKVYMLVGAGANLTLQVGDDGILLVDTGLAGKADAIFKAIRTISDKPLRYIINTGISPDLTGGNAALGKSGQTIAGGNVVGDIGASASQGAAIVAFQAVLDRMVTPNTKDTASQDAWPTDTFTTAEKNLFFNNEAIKIIHEPSANTDGNSIVFFRRSDVVSTGDIFSTVSYPRIDLERGGSFQGIIDALNQLLYQITVPGPKQERGTMIVPSHGRVCDQADLVVYQEMLTIIRDRIQAMIDKGMTLEQVEAAKPTRDYDRRYGSTTGPWTTSMFIEAAYKSLIQEKKRSGIIRRENAVSGAPAND
jgi:cyclase